MAGPPTPSYGPADSPSTASPTRGGGGDRAGGRGRPKKQPAGKPGRPPRRERSAGVLVYHDAPTGKRRFLLLDYGRHWDYAKGHVEAGEDDRTAALRELREETGITDVTLNEAFSHEIHYRFYSGKKGLVDKTVIFFVGRVKDQRVILSEEHVGYQWLEFEPALACLTFDNARDVLRAAAPLLPPPDAKET